MYSVFPTRKFGCLQGEMYAELPIAPKRRETSTILISLKQYQFSSCISQSRRLKLFPCNLQASFLIYRTLVSVISVDLHQ